MKNCIHGPFEASQSALKVVWILTMVLTGLVFLFRCCFRAAFVPTTSMEPTIHANSVAVYWTLPYTCGNPGPRRGDVIVFRDSTAERMLVKRVVAVEGDTVSFAGGQVYVNGEPDYEGFDLNPDGKATCAGMASTYLVPEGSCFVLGDNRTHSNDSRFWEDPFVCYSNIRGILMFSFAEKGG